MSQRFFRCPHCRLPHDEKQLVCPTSGKVIDRKRPSASIPKADPSFPTSREAKPNPHHASDLPPASVRATDKRRLLGQTLDGKYRIRTVLGEGGMGAVYEAEHIALGRPVAIKVLHPTQAQKTDAIKRLHQEARAAGAIGHPNICEVYDFGTLADQSPYLVMEKLIGETLSDRIDSEGALPFEIVLDVLLQVLSGLVAAHQKGVIHRDIKPENIFLTLRPGYPPTVKILDFGVSKLLIPLFSGENQGLDLTRTGMVMGTPYYMSPEQARGERNLDARVDLWACGVILYEALTGRRPFQAANYNALLMQILTSTPIPARELRPAMPAAFDPILTRALARAREERYQSATEFQRDLQTLADAKRPPAPRRISSGPFQAAKDAPLSERSPQSVGRGEHVSPPSSTRPPVGLSPLRQIPVQAPVLLGTETPMSGEQVPILNIHRLDTAERDLLLEVHPGLPESLGATYAHLEDDVPTREQLDPLDELGGEFDEENTDQYNFLDTPSDRRTTAAMSVVRYHSEVIPSVTQMQSGGEFGADGAPNPFPDTSVQLVSAPIAAQSSEEFREEEESTEINDDRPTYPVAREEKKDE